MLRTPTLWKYTTREVQRRPGRTLMTLAGIVIGVASVVATIATTRATRRSYRAMHEAVGGRAALEVVLPGGGGFDPSAVYKAVRGLDGVEAAVGVIQERAGLVGKEGVTPVLVLGADPERDRAARTFRVTAGRGLGNEGVLLVENFARQHHCEVGARVKLGTLSGLRQLPVVGLLEARGPALFNGGAFVLMPLTTAQRLFGLPGQVNSVQLVLEEDADPRRVEEEVRGRLPAGLVVQTTGERAALGREGITSIEQALDTLSVVSLVGGAFVILNSFLMNLGRRRQLAILRALGTTRRQVTRLLLREAVLLGGAGTVLGMGAGVLLAQGLVRMEEQLLGVKLPPLRLSVQPFLLALLLGPGMALAATVVPAWRAGRRPRLER